MIRWGVSRACGSPVGGTERARGEGFSGVQWREIPEMCSILHHSAPPHSWEACRRAPAGGAWERGFGKESRKMWQKWDSSAGGPHRRIFTPIPVSSTGQALTFPHRGGREFWVAGSVPRGGESSTDVRRRFKGGGAGHPRRTRRIPDEVGPSAPWIPARRRE